MKFEAAAQCPMLYLGSSLVSSPAPVRAPEFPYVFTFCDSVPCTGREPYSCTEWCLGRPRPACASESLPVRENESQDVSVSQYAKDVCLDVSQKHHQH